MQTGLKRCSFIALSAYLLVASITAFADISAGNAGEIAKQHYGGKIIGVKSGQQDGRAIYRVKLLHASGTIQVIRIDTQSGQVIN